MKYLLLAALLGGPDVVPPNAGPYDTLKECQTAAIEYIKNNAEKIVSKEGMVLRCRPVEKSDVTYVR